MLAAAASIAVIFCGVTLLLLRRDDRAPATRSWTIALIGCGALALYDGIAPIPSAPALRAASLILGLVGAFAGVALLRGKRAV
jgi:hypothetical protein